MARIPEPADEVGRRPTGVSVSLTAEGRSRRARLAANSRWRPDRADLLDERRHFKAEAAEHYIKQLVDTFPPLTAEQRRRLASLLHPETGAGDAGPT
jgi:hypothetical protein